MKLSPGARARLGALGEARTKWDHVRALVEQAAHRRSAILEIGGGAHATGSETVKQIARVALDVAELLAVHGFLHIAEDVRELHLLARRGEAVPRSALHRMKEVVTNVSHALQREGMLVERMDADEEEE